MTELLSLNKLRAGQTGIIRSFTKNGGIQFRLRELGLVRGTTILVKRLAPFLDPMELQVRGYNLSIRKKDAATVLVERVK